MANISAEIETGFPAPQYLATGPPPPSQRWTQLQSLFVRRKELTEEEKSAILKPCCFSLLTFIILSVAIVILPNILLRCNASFSVESISVSPSPSTCTWYVEFLVNQPSSRCPIYYDADGVYAKLGSLNTAVLKRSHTRRSRSHTSFKVDLATEGNQSSVVADFPRVFELYMKLSAKKIKFVDGDDYGHFDIRCQKLILDYENIKCHSSFKMLKELQPPPHFGRRR